MDGEKDDREIVDGVSNGEVATGSGAGLTTLDNVALRFLLASNATFADCFSWQLHYSD